MVAEVHKLNRFVKKNVEFIRLFNAGVREAGMDKNGRFLIPRELMRYAGLTKNLVMSSATDHIEIWDKKRYEKFMRDNSERYEQLAEEVMGQISAGPDAK
jgi:MraZ protein